MTVYNLINEMYCTVHIIQLYQLKVYFLKVLNCYPNAVSGILFKQNAHMTCFAAFF